MEFRFTAVVERPIGEVFAFFRDVDQHAGKEGTRVPAYDKVTPGPVGVGTRYREVVQLAPFIRGVMISEITRYDEGKHLGYRFSGLGMDGDLAYTFEAVEGGTRVLQVQSLSPRGVLRPTYTHWQDVLHRGWTAARGHQGATGAEPIARMRGTTPEQRFRRFRSGTTLWRVEKEACCGKRTIL